MDWVIAVFVGSGCCSGLKEDCIFYIFGFWTLKDGKTKEDEEACETSQVFFSTVIDLTVSGI